MAYKKTFQPGALVRSSEINENAKITQNDPTATFLMWIIGEDLLAFPANTGATLVFTTSHYYQPNSIAVYVDGIRMKRLTNFTETGTNQITLNVALVPTQDIIVDYIRQDIV